MYVDVLGNLIVDYPLAVSLCIILTFLCLISHKVLVVCHKVDLIFDCCIRMMAAAAN